MISITAINAAVQSIVGIGKSHSIEIISRHYRFCSVFIFAYFYIAKHELIHVI